MLLSTVLILASSLAVLADSQLSPQHGGSNPWVPRFTNLVAFGDSYTDESRLSYFQSHNGQGPPPGTLPPFSNSTSGGGVTWDRWVSEYSGATLYNYAVSGAVCDNKIIYRLLGPPVNAPFPDVVYEVSSFVADINFINTTTNTNTLYTDRKSDNTVYSMWIGTNDLGDNAFLTDSSLNGTTIPDYVDCIFDRFDSLYKNGARYFVLMNTAPLELSPLYGLPGRGGLKTSHYWQDKETNTTEVSYKMKEYTQLVNNIYAYRTPFELLVSKRYPGASIAIMDMNAFISDIYYNPSKYLASPANVTGPYHSCGAATGSTCTNSKLSLDHFLWYDDLHPSEQTDKAIAKEFINVVKGTSKYATYW